MHVRCHSHMQTQLLRVALSREYIWGRGKPRCGAVSSAHHAADWRIFSVSARRGTFRPLRIGRGIPRACLTLIYRHVVARIVAASEACGSARCAVYTSWWEAAVPRLGLPPPQVYSRLKMLESWAVSVLNVVVGVFVTTNSIFNIYIRETTEFATF